MQYAIELYFDDEGTKKVNKIRNELIKNGLIIDEGTNPHVTLAIFKDLDIKNLIDELKEFTKDLSPFSLTFSSVGMFTSEISVVFLAPIVTSNLLKVHQKFYDYFKIYEKNASSYYLPNNWVPHCTLTMDNKIKETFDVLKKIKLPFKVSVTKIGVLEFYPNRQIFEMNIS